MWGIGFDGSHFSDMQELHNQYSNGEISSEQFAQGMYADMQEAAQDGPLGHMAGHGMMGW